MLIYGAQENGHEVQKMYFHSGDTLTSVAHELYEVIDQQTLQDHNVNSASELIDVLCEPFGGRDNPETRTIGALDADRQVTSIRLPAWMTSEAVLSRFQPTNPNDIARLRKLTEVSDEQKRDSMQHSSSLHGNSPEVYTQQIRGETERPAPVSEAAHVFDPDELMRPFWLAFPEMEGKVISWFLQDSFADGHNRGEMIDMLAQVGSRKTVQGQDGSFYTYFSGEEDSHWTDLKDDMNRLGELKAKEKKGETLSAGEKREITDIMSRLTRAETGWQSYIAEHADELYLEKHVRGYINSTMFLDQYMDAMEQAKKGDPTQLIEFVAPFRDYLDYSSIPAQEYQDNLTRLRDLPDDPKFARLPQDQRQAAIEAERFKILHTLSGEYCYDALWDGIMEHATEQVLSQTDAETRQTEVMDEYHFSLYLNSVIHTHFE